MALTPSPAPFETVKVVALAIRTPRAVMGIQQYRRDRLGLGISYGCGHIASIGNGMHRGREVKAEGPGIVGRHVLSESKRGGEPEDPTHRNDAETGCRLPVEGKPNKATAVLTLLQYDLLMTISARRRLTNIPGYG
jgi:hypothetical protein